MVIPSRQGTIKSLKHPFILTTIILLCLTLIFQFQFWISPSSRGYHDSLSYVSETTTAPVDVCQAVGSRSAISLWNDKIDKIFAASQSPLDPHYQLHDRTAEVLHLITPRLFLGQRAFPRDWTVLRSLIIKLNHRYQYLLRTANNTSTGSEQDSVPDPIRVVVLGGSVTVGVNCNTGIPMYTFQNCSWPIRLEHLVNQLAVGTAGRPLIQVTNVAVGGTNTETGRVMLEYDLLPVANPDIIINAYATNDMHILTIQQAENRNVTLRDRIYEMAQGFVRSAFNLCTSQGLAPLIVWLDDYLGNEQREIIRTMEWSQSVQLLSNYYGFAFVSYADTIRDLVYGTTQESVFSPPGWYKGDRSATSRVMEREIHPTATMHIATAYVMAYYLLQLVTNYCAMHETWDLAHVDDSVAYTPLHGKLPTLSGTMPLMNRPQPRPKGIPPILNDKLRLDDVSALWSPVRNTDLGTTTNLGTTTTTMTVETTCPNRKRCPVTWLSGRDTTPEATDAYLQPYLQIPSGWQWKDDTTKYKKKKKYGFIPDSLGATMRFHFDLAGGEIDHIALFYLKSYGAKWEGSEARVQIDQDATGVANRSLWGYHDKRTSETYIEEIIVPPMKRFELSIQHTAGPTFKLLGLALCDKANERMGHDFD